MNHPLKLSSAIAAACLVFSACKPKEATPPPAPPAAAPAPAPAPEVKPAVKDAAPAALTPEEAKSHIGEVAVVRGKVFGVFQSKKGDVFISIGAAHPNAPFTAVCFQEAIPAADLKKLAGRTVSIRGAIKEYNGAVEIVLETADQISE